MVTLPGNPREAVGVGSLSSTPLEEDLLRRLQLQSGGGEILPRPPQEGEWVQLPSGVCGRVWGGGHFTRTPSGEKVGAVRGKLVLSVPLKRGRVCSCQVGGGEIVLSASSQKGVGAATKREVSVSGGRKPCRPPQKGEWVELLGVCVWGGSPVSPPPRE